MQLPFTSYFWEDPKPGYIDYRTYDVFNERPLWSAVQKREPAGTGVYGAYGTVIQFAPNLVPGPGQQQQVNDLDSQINTAHTKAQDDESASMTAFALAKKKAQSVGVDLQYTSWLVSSGWQKTLDGDKLLIDKLANEKAGILSQYPDNQKAIAAYTPPKPDDPTTDKAFLKCSVTGTEIWRAIYTAPTPHDIINMMSKGGQEMSFQLNSSKSSSKMEHSWAGGSASFDDGFFGIDLGGSWQKFDLTASGQSASLSIKFDKIDQFTVKPGDWYSGTYLGELKKRNKWSKDYSENKVFGKEGLLPLVTTNFIACIGMTISIQISQSSFDRHKEQFNASGGIRVGPFQFGGEGGHSSDKWNKKAEGSSFTVSLTDAYPYVVGYKVARADGESM